MTAPIAGSVISRALDRLQPEPRLFPLGRDPAIDDAERWGEELQNAVRRIFYCGAVGRVPSFPPEA